jgi:hypothetical protein
MRGADWVFKQSGLLFLLKGPLSYNLKKRSLKPKYGTVLNLNLLVASWFISVIMLWMYAGRFLPKITSVTEVNSASFNFFIYVR